MLASVSIWVYWVPEYPPAECRLDEKSLTILALAELKLINWGHEPEEEPGVWPELLLKNRHLTYP